MVRVDDSQGTSVAIAAPLPGERERTCEIVTEPIERDHGQHLERLLAPARKLGFSIPQEAALHIHFDATRLTSASTLANLVLFLAHYREELRKRVETNPLCRRLAPWPDALTETVRAPDFRQLSWPEARARLAQVKLTKYCDFNLINFLHRPQHLNTFEVRILPVSLEVEPVLQAAHLFVAILNRALDPRPFEPGANLVSDLPAHWDRSLRS